jgi:hypothetical protein
MSATPEAELVKEALSVAEELREGVAALKRDIAALFEYRGKRGTVWRIKYADADGRQVMETLGRQVDGWTERKAERELGHRLSQVEQGHRKPTRVTFADFAERFLAEHVPTESRGEAIDGDRLHAHDPPALLPHAR